MDLSPIWISLQTAGVTILITFFLGILAAGWIIRWRKESWKAIADGIFTLPLVLPPTVVGFLLLWIFGVNQPVGRLFLQVFHVKIAFSWIATVIAAVVISFPLMYRSARGALELVDPDLIFAARTLGMSEISIFIRVQLPNAMPGIVSGGVLAFARGLGEFGATAMLAGNIPGRTRTLPLAVYAQVAAGNMHAAGFYVVIVVGICLAAVLGLNLYAYCQKKKQGQ
jgi:molybdate transport system permease protein